MGSRKLSDWLDLRKELDRYTLPEALNKVAEYWHSPPFTPYYLDTEAAHEWPDPWTLVGGNSFCDVAKALVMLYTIHFSTHGRNISVELKTFRGERTGFEYNLVWINDGMYILNSDDGVISKDQLPKDLVLLKSYTLSDIGVDKY